MPATLWLVALPLGITPLVYLLRRSGVGALLAALVAIFLAWLVIRLPLGVVLNLLGRTIELDQLSQVTLALLFATAAALFLALTLFSLGRQGVRRDDLYSKRLGPEVRIFYPAVLVILALFVAANLVRHLGITAIFIELAAILTVFVIQTERLESTRAALRFLILISLATPLFLLAAWQIDVDRLADGLTSTRNIEQIVLFIGVGFALWLAVIPFHGWLTGTAAESSPPMAAFVLVAFPVVAFSTLIHVLVDLPWLVDSLYFVNGMLLAGVVTACVGGAMASVQRGFSELLGYAALYDLGSILIMVALGGGAAISIIFMSLTVRALAVVLIAVCTSTLHLQVADDGFTQVRGIARQMPVATAGLILGGLTLAGAPLTVGFVPYWQLLNAMTGLDSRWPAVLILAALGVTIGYLRGLRAALSPEERRATGLNLPVRFQEPLPLLIIISLLGAGCILLGLFPSFLIEPLQSATAGIVLPME